MNRSYMKIDTRGAQLGLDLVNPECDTFFLYAQPLLSMWQNRDSYILVKNRNRDGKQAIGYHPGQVLGAFEQCDDEISITLYFGPTDQDIEHDADSKRLKRVVARQVYSLPIDELEACVKAFDVVRRNRVPFDEMVTVGRSLALFER